MKEDKKTPKEQYQAGNFGHWEYAYRAGQWVPVEKKQEEEQSASAEMQSASAEMQSASAEITLLGART